MSDRKCWPQVRAATKARDFEALCYSLILAAEGDLQSHDVPAWVLAVVSELGKLERARVQWLRASSTSDSSVPSSTSDSSATAEPPASVLRLLGDL